MINPKNICVSACIGFFLSFLIGVFSDVRFSHVLLRAFIFALVFALLCVAVTFVYQKFLSSDSGAFSAETDAAAAKTSGGLVNIVIDDTALIDDGLTPKFTVAGGRAAPLDGKEARQDEGSPESSEVVSQTDLREPDESQDSDGEEALSSQSGAGGESASGGSFQAMDLNEVSSSSGSVTAVSDGSASVSPAEKKSSSGSGASEALDELPDIGGMMGDEDDSKDSSQDEIEVDTEFATGGSGLKEKPVSGDTNVMAKAIQTLLAHDNS